MRARIARQGLQRGFGKLAFCLGYQVMGAAAHRHLGQVGYHDNLVGARQIFQHGAQGTRGFAADACVYLVEHQGVYLVAFAQHHLQRQHHAAGFAAAGDLAQALGLQLATGREHQLERLRAPCIPAGTRQVFHAGFQPGTLHFQPRQLRLHGIDELGNHLGARCGQRRRGAGKGGLCGIARVRRLGNKLVAPLVLADLRGRFFLQGKHVFHARAVTAHKALQLGNAVLRLLQLFAREVYLAAIAGKLAAQVFQAEVCLAHHLARGLDARVHLGNAIKAGQGRLQLLHRAAASGKAALCGVGLPHQQLGVFQLGQALQQIFVFARLGVGLANLVQGEARAVQLHGIGLV